MPPLPTAVRALAAAAASAALLIAAGCGAARPATRTVKLAVLDGQTMFQVAKGQELTTKGWWFLQRDVLRSGNYGTITSEMLSREFRKIPGVEVYNHDDMRVYMASKERFLRRAYPDLTPADRALALATQSPIDYGRSLNVDFVMVPTIPDSWTAQHEWTNFWTSGTRVVLDVWDVNSGQLIWSWRDNDADFLDSQLSVIEELAEEAREDAQGENVFGTR